MEGAGDRKRGAYSCFGDISQASIPKEAILSLDLDSLSSLVAKNDWMILEPPHG